MPDVPTFAVAGDPNAGKSTIVATLAENDATPISKEAGTTTARTTYTWEIDGHPILRFIDLPGFQNPAQVRRWTDGAPKTTGDLPALFVEQHQHLPQYQHDCEIMRGIRGCAVLFVVDASRRPERKYEDEAEILRLCAGQRIAIINCRKNNKDYRNLWEKKLEPFFTVHTFDPHEATFSERRELLEAISHVMPRWRTPMKEAIRRFEEDRNNRLDAAVRAICALLDDVLQIEAESRPGRKTPFPRESSPGPSAKARLQVEEAVRQREQTFRAEIRRIFRHRRMDWALRAYEPLEEDIFSETVWKIFGLTRTQLVTTGAGIGAILGGAGDLLTGGASLGILAATGSALGGGAAYYAARRDYAISLPRLPHFRIHTSSQTEKARVAPQSNLLWILLDRAITYAALAANHSHGVRRPPASSDEMPGKIGPVSGLEKKNRRIFAEWLGLLRSKNAPQFESRENSVRSILKQFLEVPLTQGVVPTTAATVASETPSNAREN